MKFQSQFMQNFNKQYLAGMPVDGQI